jgi:hypothetical protein
VVVTVLLPRLSAAAATATGPLADAPSLVDRLPLALAPVAASTLLAENVALAVYRYFVEFGRPSGDPARPGG